MPSKPIPLQSLEKAIYLLRGERVMLGHDLAALYGVDTGALNRGVKRHVRRFPSDFMFQLTAKEADDLRCQIGISSWGGRRYRPYAFTEQGVAMLSGVLNSERAIHVKLEIMRVFARLRRFARVNAELAKKLDALERKYDAQFKVVFDAIRELMAPKPHKTRPIGLVTPKDSA